MISLVSTTMQWKLIHLVITYGLLTNFDVKMAGYWPSSFLDRDEVEVHKLGKKNEANIQPS